MRSKTPWTVSALTLLALAYASELRAVSCSGTVSSRVNCLTTAVTNLEGDVSTNAKNIGTNAKNIGTNKTNIATNAGAIELLGDAVAAVEAEVEAGVSAVESQVRAVADEVEHKVAGLEAEVEAKVSAVESQVQAVDDKVTAVQDDLSNLATDLTDVTRLAEEIDAFYALLPEPVLDFIARQQPVLEFYVAQELAGLEAFLGPGPGCLDPSPCYDFRQNTLELIDLLRLLMQVTVLGDPADPAPEPPIAPLRQLVASAPGPVLYPAYRAFHIGLDQLQHEIAESIDSIEAMRLLSQGDCEEIDAKRKETREHHQRLRRRTPVIKLAGKTLIAMGENEVRPLAALWGWLGFNVKVDIKKPLGSVLDGLADSMTQLSERTDRRINHCQLMAAVCSGQAGPSGNRRIPSACSEEGFGR